MNVGDETSSETPPDVEPTCQQGHYLNALGNCPQCDQEARDEATEQRSLDEWKGLVA
jgi:hypothetical protein